MLILLLHRTISYTFTIQSFILLIFTSAICGMMEGYHVGRPVTTCKVFLIRVLSKRCALGKSGL